MPFLDKSPCKNTVLIESQQLGVGGGFYFNLLPDLLVFFQWVCVFNVEKLVKLLFITCSGTAHSTI